MKEVKIEIRTLANKTDDVKMIMEQLGNPNWHNILLSDPESCRTIVKALIESLPKRIKENPIQQFDENFRITKEVRAINIENFILRMNYKPNEDISRFIDFIFKDLTFFTSSISKLLKQSTLRKGLINLIYIMVESNFEFEKNYGKEVLTAFICLQFNLIEDDHSLYKTDKNESIIAKELRDRVKDIVRKPELITFMNQEQINDFVKNGLN